MYGRLIEVLRVNVSTLATLNLDKTIPFGSFRIAAGRVLAILWMVGVTECQ